jgi:hypothetical protein
VNEITLDDLILRLGSPQAAYDYLMHLMSGGEQRADMPQVDVKVECTVAKYDGEYSPDKEPVEVLHFKD